MWQNTEKKRKIPQQARSRAMVDDILDAAVRVLIEEGLDRTSTTRIADRAGISAGSLYQYFANRDAIFDALALRQFDKLSDLLAAHGSAGTSDGLEGALGRMVDAVFEAHDGHLAVTVVFAGGLSRSGMTDPAARRTARLIVHARELLDRHAGDLHEGFDRAQAAFSIGCLVEGFVRASSLPRAAHNRPARMASEITAMLRGYLAASRR
jgi:AcrR family transcriptional regulator